MSGNFTGGGGCVGFGGVSVKDFKGPDKHIVVLGLLI